MSTFHGVRPNLVVGEATTVGAHSVDTVTDYGLQDVAKVDITMSNKFEDQFRLVRRLGSFHEEP